jgi:hypothetical protein
MQIVYTTIETEDLRKIIKTETGLSLHKFSEVCPNKTYTYLSKLDKGLLRISSESWEKLKGQIAEVKKLNKA